MSSPEGSVVKYEPEFSCYTLWQFNITIENGPVKIVDLPIENGDFPVRYVSLPEGKSSITITSKGSFYDDFLWTKRLTHGVSSSGVPTAKDRWDELTVRFALAEGWCFWLISNDFPMTHPLNNDSRVSTRLWNTVYFLE